MNSSSKSPSPRTPSPRARGTMPLAAYSAEHARSSPEPRVFDDTCMDDVESFARTVAAVKSKPRPDLLASVLSHYAAKWLPEVASSASGRFLLPPESPTATWLKKRLLLESLVAALPPPDAPADDGITCDFLLRLLRAGSMVGADAALLRELEARAARRLDQASLAAVMVPASGHAPDTLLDVPLVLRLVRGFLKEGGKGAGGGAGARVARLVDAYLAEAALEAGLRPAELEELARAVPAHARAADDALYRAVDTYLKAHPGAGKEERKALWRLIDPRKLSAEAAGHAVQNERLPVRSVMQVLFSEHGKLNRLADLGASFSGLANPGAGALLDPHSGGSARCPSKREVLAQHQEMRRLREDVARLQVQCSALHEQVERLGCERRRRGGGGVGFRWSTLWFGGGGMSADAVRIDDSESGMERRTPASGMKGRAGLATPTPTRRTPKWRKSMS
uniref:Uncharacterized protein n=1 Tax=Avena sativa TaxID=4498 RepID=A0ACD5VE44_AVESA